SGPTTMRRSLFGYGSEARKCCMQLRRARFLSSDLTIVHGASAVSVLKNIASFASVYSSHLSSEALSIGDSFHCFRGSVSRAAKRRRCSSRVTENQYLYRRIPERTSIRSISGHWRMNSRYSFGLQKPITRSTPARLYQERSKNTISPAAGRWLM